MMHRTLLESAVLVLLLSASVSAQGLQVRHDHDPWGSCEGELEITSDGIRYEPIEGDHDRTWTWVDIQNFDRRSPDEFSLLTYEDFVWHLGLDRAFDFTVLAGESTLDDASFARIRANLSRPVIDRMVLQIEPEYQVAVKHLHLLGGCDGVLTFGEDWVVYETDHEQDARTWGRDELASLWSSGSFELELRVLEKDRRAFSTTSTFKFQLKAPLNRDYYELLRREFLLRR